MRILSWNIEWMNNWFVGSGQVEWRDSHPSTGITDVQELAGRVAQVIDDIDPDVLTIQEGPSDPREMLLFTDRHLLAQGVPRFNVFGGIDGGSQKNYILVKRGGELSNARLATDAATCELEAPWESDIDGDLLIDSYEFTRRPLVVTGHVEGDPIRVVTMHTKSKYVHNGKNLWNDPDRRQDFVSAAIKNRRRISSEGMRTRQYLDRLLDDDTQAKIVVTGDLNDGPGMDYFELRYLTHNVTDILLGSTFRPERMFRHGFRDTTPEPDRYTAVFDDFVDEIPNRRLLLDHILVSPALTDQRAGEIAHAPYEAGIDHGAAGRQKYPSDHRPVLVDV